jgi:hypothetical protein
VRNLVQKVFKKEPIVTANVDEVVVLGAAIYAARHADKANLTPLQAEAISKVKIQERTGRFLGTLSLMENESRGGKIELVNQRLIGGEKVADIIVESSELKAVEEACAKLTEAGAKRALILQVGGAFHSPLMEPARAELASAIESTAFNAPICPIYQNVNALPVTDPTLIKANLLAQLTAPVKWTQIMMAMNDHGLSEVIEVGPGKVLQGLFKKINRELPVSSASIG